MKVVVDTNIIFSALLKTNSVFGQIMFHSDGIFQFYTVQHLRSEIRKNWSKLRRLSKLTDQQLEESYYTLLTKISFISEELIPQKIWVYSERLVEDIDVDDVDFVALTEYLRGMLWTGDKTLREGLKRKGFKKVLGSDEIFKRWSKKRKR